MVSNILVEKTNLQEKKPHENHLIALDLDIGVLLCPANMIVLTFSATM